VIGGQADAAGARRKVLDGAIAAICELGYYRASSNAIAQKASVTWGSIQHHFGSREGLMLAVLEDSVDRLVRQVSTCWGHGEEPVSHRYRRAEHRSIEPFLPEKLRAAEASVP
jgi:AcrR family transcriptional regulator